jgi:DNA-binding NtrC family response regulator
VLITGESGVGKELVARALHAQSQRASEAFVALNCAAILRELIENELFGHEKGAFTGAVAQRKGKLEEAENGTLFLDEIGDMPLNAQAKLLRFLEESEIQRVGGSETFKLDVRVVAATNKNLPENVSRGTFREDLFHRLNVVAIPVPSLRERRDDIGPLALTFLERYCRRHNRALQLAPECMDVLRAYDWPGNVRELRNAIERCVVLASSSPVEPDELSAFLDSSSTIGTQGNGTLRAAYDRAEREAVEHALAVSGGVMNQAARLLGVERTTLYRLIKKHNLRSTDEAVA